MICLRYSSPAKLASRRRKLPRPEDFSKALYILDIGQNDISSGLSKPEEELQAAYIPELVNKLSAAVQVSFPCHFLPSMYESVFFLATNPDEKSEKNKEKCFKWSTNLIK